MRCHHSWDKMARDMSGCGHLDQDNCSDGRRVAIIIDLRQGRGRVNAEQCDHDTQRGQASSSWRARLRHTTTTTNHPHHDRSHTDTRFHQHHQQQTILHFPSVYTNHHQLAKHKNMPEPLLPASPLLLPRAGPATSCCTLCKSSSALHKVSSLQFYQSEVEQLPRGAGPHQQYFIFLGQARAQLHYLQISTEAIQHDMSHITG